MILSKITYFAILGLLTAFVIVALVAVSGVLGVTPNHPLAENTLAVTRDKARIISIKEPPVMLSGGSALISAHPLVETLELDNAVIALPNTQFAGKYGNKSLFNAPCGMQIKTSFPGLIVAVGRPEQQNNGKGGYISIQNANTMRIITYSHLSAIHVAPGIFVEQGQALGIVGLSGDIAIGGGCQIGITIQ